jgi:hypothetical protein
MADHFAQAGAGDQTARDVAMKPLGEFDSPRVLLLQHGAQGRAGLGGLPGALRAGGGTRAHAAASLVKLGLINRCVMPCWIKRMPPVTPVFTAKKGADELFLRR